MTDETKKSRLANRIRLFGRPEEEDIVNHFPQELVDDLHRAMKLGENRAGDNYELYQFLETEITRLTHAHTLLSQKLQNLEENPQGPRLIDEQKLNIKRAKIELIKAMSHPDSETLREFSILWKLAGSTLTIRD